jgi:asparagine synthase (glutamine-hydrolysing)
VSGLVALLDRDGGTVDRDVFRAALDAIDHRGPDGCGSWRDGPVALGHQQLQSTPESRVDDQPYRDGDLVVTADARLDNRDELFGALDIFPTGGPVPDSHLLLEAYREWGAHCVDHLVGAFAFAVWDEAAGQLFCARDHLGVKPLYYAHAGDTFAAASEVKALLTHPAVATTLDEAKIGDFLLNVWDNKERTYYEAVSRLPPAHAADYADQIT